MLVLSKNNLARQWDNDNTKFRKDRRDSVKYGLNYKNFTLLKENTGIRNTGRFWDRVSNGTDMVSDIVKTQIFLDIWEEDSSQLYDSRSPPSTPSLSK